MRLFEWVKMNSSRVSKIREVSLHRACYAKEATMVKWHWNAF